LREKGEENEEHVASLHALLPQLPSKVNSFSPSINKGYSFSTA
jgi:hypothetical protein